VFRSSYQPDVAKFQPLGCCDSQLVNAFSGCPVETIKFAQRFANVLPNIKFLPSQDPLTKYLCTGHNVHYNCSSIAPRQSHSKDVLPVLDAEPCDDSTSLLTRSLNGGATRRIADPSLAAHEQVSSLPYSLAQRRRMNLCIQISRCFIVYEQLTGRLTEQY